MAWGGFKPALNLDVRNLEGSDSPLIIQSLVRGIEPMILSQTIDLAVGKA